jgi:hypothetical protein
MAGRPSTGLLLAACLLTACGGGGGDTSSGSGNSGGTQPPSGIGSAGGTVNGPNGAKVVVPAGALSQSTNIAEQPARGLESESRLNKSDR